MNGPFRIGAGVGLTEGTPIVFRFDGRPYAGLKGDTLASALLANGVQVVARSLKYHRPRGIIGFGVEECNALVQLGQGPAAQPNVVATMVPIEDGLEAFSQNAFPSVRFDLGAVGGLLSGLLGAGFYYKTFMWPEGFWRRYEEVIRRAAGLGRAPDAIDPDHYEKVHHATDVLVVGSGPSGLEASLAAAEAGADVLLVEQADFLGGSLASWPLHVGDITGAEWLAGTLDKLKKLPKVRILKSATVFGHYRGGLFGIAERCPRKYSFRERLWRVTAKRAILATGAIERPLVFPDNDRPGIMLASATSAYLHRYGVASGRQVAIATNNDSAYRVIPQLKASGVNIAAIVDRRETVPVEHVEFAKRAAVRLLSGCMVFGTRGRHALREIHVAPLVRGKPDIGRGERIAVDHLAISGGWTPVVHLHSQSGAPLAYQQSIRGFVPAGDGTTHTTVGAANGTFDVAAAIEAGRCAGEAVAASGSSRSRRVSVLNGFRQDDTQTMFPPNLAKRSFVDFQNDVTANDIAQALQEGYHSIEHVKRYTTLGMGTDQGKTGNLNGAGLLAVGLEKSIEQVGLTTYRPPYTPVTVGTLVGREVDKFAHPIRRTDAHHWHESHGAVMMNAGAWRRPHCFPQAGETLRQTVIREVSTVRSLVGMVDVSTLGKIDIQGRDAAEFLDRVYLSRWKKLAVGRARYGLMLRDDGAVFDDGVTARLGDRHFVMTTTTLNAEAVGEWLEFLLQSVWPDLDVFATPVTDHWFAAALNGPLARRVLQRLTDIDVSDAVFPHMAIREADIAGITGRILRISFSGELAYEINVPADFGLALWDAVLDAGRDFGIVVYGVESMATMRIEKGHVVIGAEADGRATADDLGFEAPKDPAKRFIGQRSLRLPALAAHERKQLVGVSPVKPSESIPAGAHVVPEPHLGPQTTLGHVTSYAFSPELGRDVGLALLTGGRARIGETLFLVSPVEGAFVQVTITGPCHLDPEGNRARA
jgi:sarcosine oxidase, subunit alpha